MSKHQPLRTNKILLYHRNAPAWSRNIVAATGFYSQGEITIKKLLCALLVTLLFTSFAFAADFRNLSWGMSKQEVINKESEKLVEVNSNGVFDVLGGETTIAELRTFMTLDFLENKLVSARYIFVDDNINKDLYLVDFNTVANLLTEIYGKPVKQNNYLPKGWEDSAGNAILSQRAYYENFWNDKNDNFAIQCLMGVTGKMGDTYEIVHFVEYSNYANQHAIQKAETSAMK